MSVRQLRCPSCDAGMQEVDRRGVTIDICRDCRGIFLDRGELDRLLDLTAADPSVPLPGDADEQKPRREQRRDGDRDEDFEAWRESHRHGKRRRSFLDDFFDLG